MWGNVHGGNILRMCEEAGRIVTTRWSRGPVVLVGASKTQFRAPVHVGEVAKVEAELDYVARHVMRVSVTVEAEHLETGVKRATNASAMWFSTVDIGPGTAIARGSRTVHPLHPSQVAPGAAAEHRLVAQIKKANSVGAAAAPSPSEFPVVLQVMPELDAVWNHPFVSAGYILRLMDTAGAMAAIAHARRPCVTVLLDQVCFRTPICVGDLCTVRSGVTYTSSRSIEVVVQVWTSRVVDAGVDAAAAAGGGLCAVEARFVFVALGGDDGHVVMAVPELPPEQRTKRWAAGAIKHEERVAQRATVVESRE